MEGLVNTWAVFFSLVFTDRPELEAKCRGNSESKWLIGIELLGPKFCISILSYTASVEPSGPQRFFFLLVPPASPTFMSTQQKSKGLSFGYFSFKPTLILHLKRMQMYVTSINNYYGSFMSRFSMYYFLFLTICCAKLHCCFLLHLFYCRVAFPHPSHPQCYESRYKRKWPNIQFKNREDLA